MLQCFPLYLSFANKLICTSILLSFAVNSSKRVNTASTLEAAVFVILKLSGSWHGQEGYGKRPLQIAELWRGHPPFLIMNETHAPFCGDKGSLHSWSTMSVLRSSPLPTIKRGFVSKTICIEISSWTKKLTGKSRPLTHTPPNPIVPAPFLSNDERCALHSDPPNHLLRTCRMLCRRRRWPTSWACTVFATGNGISRRAVPQRAMASTKALTGSPPHSKRGSKKLILEWRGATTPVIGRERCSSAVALAPFWRLASLGFFEDWSADPRPKLASAWEIAGADQSSVPFVVCT